MYTETMTWPQGKRCAALITVNLDAEYFWLQLDPAAKEMPKTLSMGQYGMLRGVDRLLDVLARYQIKATFFCPGKVAATGTSTKTSPSSPPRSSAGGLRGRWPPSRPSAASPAGAFAPPRGT